MLKTITTIGAAIATALLVAGGTAGVSQAGVKWHGNAPSGATWASSSWAHITAPAPAPTKKF